MRRVGQARRLALMSAEGVCFGAASMFVRCRFDELRAKKLPPTCWQQESGVSSSSERTSEGGPETMHGYPTMLPPSAQLSEPIEVGGFPPMHHAAIDGLLLGLLGGRFLGRLQCFTRRRFPFT